MALRMFKDSTAWECARREVRFVSASLQAIETHANLAQILLNSLQLWREIETERRAADDALVDASARVHRLDTALNALSKTVAQKLTLALSSEGQPLGLRSFFPDTTFGLVWLGLESELQRLEPLAQLAKQLPLSTELQSLLSELETQCQAARQALRVREKAVSDAARVSLRMQAWRESSMAARLSIEQALQAYGADHGLAADYADGFFPPKDERFGGKDEDDGWLEV